MLFTNHHNNIVKHAAYLILAAIVFNPVATAHATEQASTSEFPGRRVGGGSRGECPSNGPFVALSPESHLIKTANANPTLYFLLPNSNQPLQLELVIKSREGDTVVNTVFEAISNDGISGVVLPERTVSLELEQDYKWYLSIICDANHSSRAQNPIVFGWMRRVADPSTVTEMDTEDVTQMVQEYQEAELWQETISTLIQSQSTQTSDSELVALWGELLEAEGLSQVLANAFTDNQLPSYQAFLVQE
ncbi:MAG: DUF928 domain-containing protein [Cyanobacteria bacterium P01_F01_bin.150]